MLTDVATDRPGATSLAQLRLMQLISPALPIGAFTYSQGVEYAVECGWVTDVASLNDWLSGLMQDNLALLDIPVLQRLYHACASNDVEAASEWADYLLACRETRELRQEELNRAKAMTRLLIDLQLPQVDTWKEPMQQTQLLPYASAAVTWGIPLKDAALGYAWSWLENLVAAAIKLVPLGQTDGQRVELQLSEQIPAVVERGLLLEDAMIGASAPAMALASSLHETQYTRLFRS